MPVDDLTNDDRALIGRCLRAAAAGPFFNADHEFHSIFGVSQPFVRDLANAWPDVDAAQVDVHCAITNSMNNLLGYPHKTSQADWDEWIAATPESVLETLARWLGRQPTSYFDEIE